MPIHDVGYRTWKGKLTSSWTRWWIISEAGIQTALKSRWIRRVLLASWFPVLYFGVCIFVFEQMMERSGSEIFQQVAGIDVSSLDNPIFNGELAPPVESADQSMDSDTGLDPEKKLLDEESRKKLQAASDKAANDLRLRILKSSPPFSGLPNADALVDAIATDDERIMRNTTWNWLLSTFLRYSQGMITLMIVGLIVPPLISRDVRSRAFLLYYSRPITRLEYLVGKIAIPGFVLLLVTLFPAMTLYFFALMMSPDLSVIFDTWEIPVRIVLATIVCIVPTCLLGLLFSAMTQESRFAGFAWFTVWGLGAVVWWVIYISNSGGEVPFDSNWSLVSIYTTIGRVQAWVFGLETSMSRVLPSVVTLSLISVFAFIGLYRRVSAPVRI